MFASKVPSACAFVGIFLATIVTVACDYGGHGASNLENGNGLCSGGRCVGQAGNEASGAMWFGPRLGRRRRSDDRIGSSDDDVNAIVDAITGGLRSLISYRVSSNGDKRHTTQFTPRLGRELVQDFSQKFLDYTSDDNPLLGLFNNQGDLDWQRQPPPPPYAPRLGRYLPFNPSPRLGRQLPLSRKA